MDTVDNADWRTSSYSGTNGGNCVEIATWRKSTRSGTNGDCVEVGGAGRAVVVRDTKDRDGGALAFTPDAWAAFTASLRH
jgi:Domain of unknown function (DUF397)